MGSDCRSQAVFLRNFSPSPHSAGHHGYNLDTLAVSCVVLIEASNRVEDGSYMVTPSNDLVRNCVN